MTIKFASSTNNSPNWRNIIVAIVAIALAILLYFSSNLKNPSTTLAAQAASSTPLEIALSNGKPTLMEFYADWCTSCQHMSGDLAEIKQQFGTDINFTMLNVDNSKWLPEITKYRVDGIPHFVFFNDQGKTILQAIGEQPKSVINANLTAMINHQPLPFTANNGSASALTAQVKPVNDSPIAHSN